LGSRTGHPFGPSEAQIGKKNLKPRLSLPEANPRPGRIEELVEDNKRPRKG
jgi:hypothetical protein